MALAQSYYGGLRGMVQDDASAAVTQAKVTLTQEGTGESRSTVSSAEGEYVFSQVVPGTYTITVEHPGFKKFDRKGVIVGTQQQLTVDVKLSLGEVTQTVQVTEDVPLVEASNASQGQVLDNKKLVELPNLGRNPFMMSKLSANVVQTGQPSYNRMQDQSGSSSISIAGGPVRGNNYLIDGIPITDANNRAVIIPSLEAVQEVKIQANTYDAEMARTGGGMFNTFMKSGTNDFHGSLYGHMRQTSWDANFFFNNMAGVPLADQPNRTWGASFGGPVEIPKVYNGKNKTFFWLAWEGYNDTQANSQLMVAPTLAERKGDFSKSFAKAGGLQTIYDPLTTVFSNGAYTRTPFTGNVIPATRINTVGQNIANTYVTPTSTASYYGAQNVNASTTLPSRAAQYTAKFDEQLTNWWRASLSYLRYFSLEPGNDWFPTVSSPDQWLLQRRVDATQINSLFTVSPTTVVAVRYGMNRFPNYGYQQSQGFDLSTLGFDKSYTSQVVSPTFPNVSMQSMYSLGTNNNFYYVHASRSFSASVAQYRGKHSLKAGVDYRRIKADGNNFDNSAGYFVFDNVFTRATPSGGGTASGADIADMLLGYASTGSYAYVPTKLRDFADYYALFVQDDVRLTSKLTLNYGLRWEREPGLQERNNGMVTGFDTNAVNPLAAGVTGIVPKGVVEFAGVNGNPTGVGNPVLNKFGPRAGLAFQINPKTVVRGGYGMFWAPQFAIGSPLNPPGYTAQTSYVASNDGNGTPAGTLTNPFPSGFAQPTGNTLGALAGIGQTLSIVSPWATSPRVQQFSVDVQRELPAGIALALGYVGSRTSHLNLTTGNININALNPTNFAMGAAALNAPVANPFYGKGGKGVIGNATVSAYQLLLPFPTFSAINLQFADDNRASYDSMVAKVQKRMGHGLTLLSAFTWSKNMDGASGGAGNFMNSGNVGPQNPYNMAAEYGLSYADTTLRWATAFTYELPVGKGRRFATKTGVLDYIIGGWALNGVGAYQSGFPLQISQSSNLNSAFGYASQRPNSTGINAATSGSVQDRLFGYLNPAAFSSAAQFTFGNLSRTIDVRGPGMKNWDLSMFKTISIKDRFKAQIRGEALNAFNSPQFAAPNVSYGSSSFGRISSQVNFARQMQLALRLSF